MERNVWEHGSQNESNCNYLSCPQSYKSLTLVVFFFWFVFFTVCFVPSILNVQRFDTLVQKDNE